MRGSIDDLFKGLEDYKKSLRAKAAVLAKALAEAGCGAVSITYGVWPYRGPREVDVTVEQRGETSYAIVANGKTVLFLEFGAGVSYSANQHPLAGTIEGGPYGPGTYPGQVHAMDLWGWYLPKEAGGGHTYGNAPSMAMYNTAKSLREVIEEVARGVFRG